MDWQTIGGFGIAIASAFLPYVVKAMPKWIALSGFIFGLLLAIYGFLPDRQKFPTGPVLLIIISFAGMVGGIYWWHIVSSDELPSKSLAATTNSSASIVVSTLIPSKPTAEEIEKETAKLSKIQELPLPKPEASFPFVDVELVRVKAEPPFEQFQAGFSYDIFLHNKSNAVLSQIGIMRLINPEKNKQKIAVRARSALKLKPFDKRINVLSPDEKKLLYREMSESYEYMVITVKYRDDLDNRYKCIFEGDRDGLQLKKRQRLNHKENLIKEHEKDQKK
jgi:hypothetical protein